MSTLTMDEIDTLAAAVEDASTCAECGRELAPGEEDWCADCILQESVPYEYDPAEHGGCAEALS